MEQQEELKIKLISNETIISLYHTNHSFIIKNTKKCNKTYSLSRVLRIIMWGFFPIVAIVGWVYAGELDKNLFSKILFAIVGMCASGIVSGSIILLLKPVFYLIRIHKYKLNKELSKHEIENRALEILFISQNTPDPLPKITKEMYVTNIQKITFKNLIKNYNVISDEYTADLVAERNVQLEKEKSDEWAWVGTAGILSLILGCIILTVIALYFLFVFLAFVIFIAILIGFLTRDREYRPLRKQDNYYDYEVTSDKSSLAETMLDIVTDIAYGKSIESKEKLKNIRNRLEINKAEKSELYKLLKFYIPQIEELYKDNYF